MREYRARATATTHVPSLAAFRVRVTYAGCVRVARVHFVAAAAVIVVAVVIVGIVVVVVVAVAAVVVVTVFASHLPPSEQARTQDLRFLKEKVDAGADFIISQFVFDPAVFLAWRQACRGIGISEPIVAGYLPLQRCVAFPRTRKYTPTCSPI